MSNEIILFDLDGTLTPARQSITDENVAALLKLISTGARVGIVTGSGLDYVKQQVHQELFDRGLEVFPCNGTQHWIYSNSSKSWERAGVNYDMKERIGHDAYKSLILGLVKKQHHFMMTEDIPFTGTFISYRGSMLNWCPIGRDAGEAERRSFESFDSATSWRLSTLSSLNDEIEGVGLTAKLGGVTSFDIFPAGWDKSIVLQRFSSDDRIWFVGDRCTGSGNDREIYEALLNYNTSFEVKTHDETPAVIDLIIWLSSREFFEPPY